MQNVRQLSKEFLPKRYQLQLDLTGRADRVFAGQVTIEGALLADAPCIPLHGKELTYLSATVNGQTAEVTAGENDEVAVTPAQPLAAGDYTIEISFKGQITDAMNGLYPCYFTLDGQKEELLATQFESHAARQVFPCVDEPAAKATFDLTLTTEPDIATVSNTPILHQAEQDGALITTFETTPVMSTYLLAWVTGKLAHKEATTTHGVIVRAYATPAHVDEVDFALDTAVRTLELFNDFFGTPYPLPKCDMIALPDFAAGAMENWGCITYRETAFFVNEFTSVGTKQRVAEVVAHELAHQWFGNLVTMKWWNDLWLNESFATWMAAYARDKLFPKWQIWSQFYNEEVAYALDRDALKSIQSVQQDVHHPDEIRTLFDGAIVYAKGASLVNMVHGYMGEEAFQKGLQTYMQHHAYQNTTANDLWDAWSEASGKDISAFMTPWISQPGHPLVRVQQQGNQVTLSQQRFYNNPADYQTTQTTIWPVPLLADGIDQPLLSDQRAVFTYQSKTPLFLNKGQTGFYLPLYSPEHLQTLGQEVAAGRLSILDRLALISTGFDLAKAGQQSTVQLARLLESYKNEEAEPVWDGMSGAIGALRTVVNEDEQLKPYVQKLAGNLARQQYERLGWERIQGEAYFDQLLRPTIISLMGYSEDPAVIAKASELLTNAERPQDVLGDIRSIIFSLNARHGDEATFDRLIAMFKAETSPEVRVQLTAGLCSVRDPQRITTLISLLRSEHVKLQDVFYWVVYLTRNKDARPAMWQWIQENWDWLMENFADDGHIGDFPRYTAGSFATKEELASYEAFFGPMRNNPLLSREIMQGIENIKARIAWRERDFTDVAEHLKQHVSLD